VVDSVPSATIRSSGGESALALFRTFARKGWLIAVALVAVVFLTYRPCWYGGFLWDDESHLTHIAVFQPLGYHLVSIALHAISALLVWRILGQLQIGGGLPGSGICENSAVVGPATKFSQIPLQWPLFAAAIFALHPVNVASVAWMGHLKDVLAVTLALTSVLFYFSYERHAGLRRYGLAIGAFLLSTLAAGIAVTLPIVLLACAWWQRGRIDRRDLLRVLPFILIGAVMAGVQMWAQQTVAQGAAVRSDGLLSRAAVAGCAVWFYLGKLIWPFDLSPVYPRWNIEDVSLLSFLPGLLLLLVLAAAWWQRGTWGRPVVMLIVCYVALLLPALGFVNLDFMRYSLVADHWQYLAMIVPIAVFAGFSAFVARQFLRSPAATVASAAFLVGLAILSWNQSEIYGDAETFYPTTIERNRECWPAYSKLGDILLHRGKIDLAIANCERAIELKPDDAEAQFTLAVALTKRGQDDLAIPHFQRAVELVPDDAEAHNDLSAALRRRGQVDQAIAQSEKAIAIQPNFAEAHLNLGLALAASGKMDSAIGQYQKALAIRPNYFEAEYSLALTLFDQGQAASAVTHFQKALAIKPDSAEAEYHLAIALASRDDADSAIAHFQKALEIQPDFAEAHYNLGNALLERKEYDSAIAHYRKAIGISPSFVAAHSNLATALADLGDDDSAILQYQKALEIKPDYEIASKNLPVVQSRRESVAKTLAERREAMRLHPNDAARINDVAWTLATNPNASIRNGVEAIKLAAQALQLAGADNPAILSTLAAAYAEAGRFSEAVRTGEQAVRLATAAGDSAAAKENQARLELYKTEKPYREAPRK
jgi:tetratricopeptide (TPR) repeat protein